MQPTRSNRRVFLTIVGCLAGGTLPWSRAQSATADDLARLLSLRQNERRWLAALSPAEIATVHAGLTSAEPAARECATEIVATVLQPQERLMTYAGYPRSRIRNICDGLFRE
jgi:hypothetical protein